MDSKAASSRRSHIYICYLSFVHDTVRLIAVNSQLKGFSTVNCVDCDLYLQCYLHAVLFRRGIPAILGSRFLAKALLYLAGIRHQHQLTLLTLLHSLLSLCLVVVIVCVSGVRVPRPQKARVVIISSPISAAPSRSASFRLRVDCVCTFGLPWLH